MARALAPPIHARSAVPGIEVLDAPAIQEPPSGGIGIAALCPRWKAAARAARERAYIASL
jgi:hypothetical protein